MKKTILHFGQDPDKKEFYNLIVKITDIDLPETSNEINSYLLTNGFTLYYSDENTIEAALNIDTWM
jgi:hypothetical protein